MTESKPTEDTHTKRRQILDAAYQVFSQKGYNRATVDEIIKLADTGKGTVYNYFTSKEQLFYTLIKERSEPLEKDLTVVIESNRDPLGKVQEMVKIFLRFYMVNGDLWHVVMHEMRGFDVTKISQKHCERYGGSFRRTIGMLETVLHQGVVEGVFRDFDSPKIASSLFSVIVMMAFENFVSDIEEDAKKITELFLYGIVQHSHKD